MWFIEFIVVTLITLTLKKLKTKLISTDWSSLSKSLPLEKLSWTYLQFTQKVSDANQAGGGGGGNTGKNCAHRFLAKQKPNNPKTYKPRGLGRQHVLCERQLLNSLKKKWENVLCNSNKIF